MNSLFDVLLHTKAPHMVHSSSTSAFDCLKAAEVNCLIRPASQLWARRCRDMCFEEICFEHVGHGADLRCTTAPFMISVLQTAEKIKRNTVWANNRKIHGEIKTSRVIIRQNVLSSCYFKIQKGSQFDRKLVYDIGQVLATFNPRDRSGPPKY